MNPQPQTTKPNKPAFGLASVLIGTFFALLKLFAKLPYPAIQKCGSAIGRLLYLVKSRRKIVLANLKHCFPELSEAQQKSLCKAHFKSLGQGFAELAAAWYKPFSKLGKYHQIIGLEHYQQAINKQKGILFLGYHTTSLELAGAVMSHYLDFAAFYRPNKNPVIDYHIQTGRNNRTPTIGRNDIRSIGKWLRSGKNLWLMPDQDKGLKSAVFAPLFGKPAATLNSPSRIAKLGNASVLPVSYYKKDGKMVVEISPEITFTGDDHKDCTLINQVLQQSILKATEQYYWIHRRFKTQPENQPSIYQ